MHVDLFVVSLPCLCQCIIIIIITTLYPFFPSQRAFFAGCAFSPARERGRTLSSWCREYGYFASCDNKRCLRPVYDHDTLHTSPPHVTSPSVVSSSQGVASTTLRCC
jgi:hypothetical protein